MPRGNQVGRVYEDGGRWYVDYFDPGGRRVRRPTEWSNELANRRKAERLLRAIIYAIQDGQYREDDFFGPLTKEKRSARTFEEQAAIYMGGLVLKESTLASYRSRLKAAINPVIGHKQIGSVKASELGADYKAICAGASTGTKLCYFTLIRGVFDQAVKDRIIDVDANPALHLRPPRKEEKPLLPEDVYSAGQIALLIESAKAATWPGFANFVALMAYTGMRPGELCALRWDAVNLAQGFIELNGTISQGRVTTPKSRAGRRRVELMPLAVDVLRSQMQETLGKSEFVLLSMRGKSGWQSSSSLTKHWNKVTRHARAASSSQTECAIIRPLPLHSLRHSYASICITAGVPLFWLSRQLGHGTTETTEKTYARWLPDQDGGRQGAKIMAALMAARPAPQVLGGGVGASVYRLQPSPSPAAGPPPPQT